jgi:hypothetical protein
METFLPMRANTHLLTPTPIIPRKEGGTGRYHLTFVTACDLWPLCLRTVICAGTRRRLETSTSLLIVIIKPDCSLGGLLVCQIRADFAL